MPVNATFGSIVHAGKYRWQIPPVNATGQPWSQHVSRVCKSANYYLHCIRKIRNFISMDVCKLLVHILVMVRLDYCNAFLCGAREDIIRQLE